MKMTHALLLALGLTAVMAIHSVPAYAGDTGSSDVFADEGDADFDHIPTEVSKVPSAPAMKVQAAATGDAKDTDDAPAAKPAEQHFDSDDAAPAPVPEHREIHRRNVKSEVKEDGATVATANGFRTTGKDCPMYREPASEGDPMLTVKSDKRIWVEPKGEWVRAYSKAGPGYISADCLK